jgi:hypothetical protein
VLVHSQEREAAKEREASILTSGGVANGEARATIEDVFSGDDEEAVAAGLQLVVGVVKRGDVLELASGVPMVEGDDVQAVFAAVV